MTDGHLNAETLEAAATRHASPETFVAALAEAVFLAGARTLRAHGSADKVSINAEVQLTRCRIPASASLQGCHDITIIIPHEPGGPGRRIHTICYCTGPAITQ